MFAVRVAVQSEFTVHDPVMVSYMVFLDMPSGLRRGELAGLKWEDFDFKNLHVSVTRSLVDQHVGPVKNGGIEKADAD
jgi:integrase